MGWRRRAFDIWLRVAIDYLIGCVAVHIPVGGQTACRICGGNENGALIRARARRTSPASSTGNEWQGGLHEPETGNRRQTLHPHVHRSSAGPHHLSPSSILFSRQQLPRAIAWPGRRSRVHPIRMPQKADCTRGHHHFNASERRTACATIQLLNRRIEKFKQRQKVRAIFSLSTTTRWCAWPSRFISSETIFG